MHSISRCHGIQSSSSQFFISVKYLDRSNSDSPLPSTALCQLRIIFIILASLLCSCCSRKLMTPGFHSRAQTVCSSLLELHMSTQCWDRAVHLSGTSDLFLESSHLADGWLCALASGCDLHDMDKLTCIHVPLRLIKMF